jgi:nicotinamidase-related amidase
VHDELPLPPHYEPDRVADVWRVDYERRFADAVAWAARHELAPSTRDEQAVCLLVVDGQNTFCTPGFELFVGGRSGVGALEDSRRLCAFVYRNLGLISQTVATLDTHQAFQIFHAPLLVGPDGRPPDPYTLVSTEDVASGRWRINGPAAIALGLDPEYLETHLSSYARALRETGKYELTVWPFHALLGGIGHALVSAVEEALFFHAIARTSPTVFELKGDRPLTEHYSALGPEVLRDFTGSPLGSRNGRLIERLLRHEAVVVAGQAKSHCVAWTVEDLLGDPLVREHGLADRLYLLEDCTSPVVVPGVIDYTEAADEAFARFAAKGAHIVRSTDPVATWPGPISRAAAARA